MAAGGNYVYVVHFNSTNMMVFNVSNPAAPSLSATYLNGLQRLYRRRIGHLCLANTAGNMLVFNVNPAAPSLIANIA
ncbi:MAG: hypothetical protein IPG74_16610 [Flavobacteriales bacterium]|nr:hypothetical protein [Flavobacteriales bacterium]